MPPDVPSVRLNLDIPGETLAFAGENCETCTIELKERVLDAVMDYLLQEKGKSKTKKAPAAPSAPDASSGSASRIPGGVPEKDRTCPLCRSERGKKYVAKTRSALGQHLHAQHGTTFKKLGMTLPTGKAASAYAA